MLEKLKQSRVEKGTLEETVQSLAKRMEESEMEHDSQYLKLNAKIEELETVKVNLESQLSAIKTECEELNAEKDKQVRKL